MPTPLQPSDIYKAFTWPRLIALASIMVERREWVVNDAKPELGDSRCGVGFRAWEHTKFAVTKAAAHELSPWLSISDAGSAFKFKLGMMPIRFVRGDSESPLPENYAFADLSEKHDAAKAFDIEGQSTVEGVFRFVIQADSSGRPLGVFLVHADTHGNPKMSWSIPRADDGSGIVPMVTPQTPIILGTLEVPSVDEAAERTRVARELAEKADANEKRKAQGDNKEKGA